MKLSLCQYTNETISCNTNIHCDNNFKMKIFTYFISFCLIFIAVFNNAHCGLVSGIIGKIHDTAHKLHEDVHNIFIPKDKNNQNLTGDNSKRENKASISNTGSSNNEKSDDKIIFATNEDKENEKFINDNNPVNTTPVNVYNNRPTVVENKSTTEEIFVFASSPSTASPISSTTKKEGRENFAAGCSTGFKRTPDGRCKPTI